MYSPGRKFSVTFNLSSFLRYVCVNQMATNVGQNKTCYVYLEIFNQITHTKWACFTVNEISFKEMTENVCPGLYIYLNRSIEIYFVVSRLVPKY